MMRSSISWTTSLSGILDKELKIGCQAFPRINKRAFRDKEHDLYRRFNALNRTPHVICAICQRAVESENPEVRPNSMVSLVNWRTGKAVRTFLTLQ